MILKEQLQKKFNMSYVIKLQLWIRKLEHWQKLLLNLKFGRFP